MSNHDGDSEMAHLATTGTVRVWDGARKGSARRPRAPRRAQFSMGELAKRPARDRPEIRPEDPVTWILAVMVSLAKPNFSAQIRTCLAT